MCNDERRGLAAVLRLRFRERRHTRWSLGDGETSCYAHPGTDQVETTVTGYQLPVSSIVVSRTQN